MTWQGRVRNGVVVLDDSESAPFPDGTLVEVTAVRSDRDHPRAVLVSEKRREALLGLIGIWKTAQPPSDEEVERLVEEQRMKKHR